MVTNRREHLAAGGLLALAALVLFSQLTQHPSDLLVGVQRDGRNDVTSHTLAARSVIKNEFAKSGDIALWHGRGLLGSPWLGNPQSALFYPPHWLFFFADVAAWISWMTVAHHWFAGLGVYFLSRREGVCWSGATVAAICFAAAPFLIAQTGEGHSTQVFLIAWAPWAFLVYDYLRSGTRGAWAVMSLVLSTAFFLRPCSRSILSGSHSLLPRGWGLCGEAGRRDRSIRLGQELVDGGDRDDWSGCHRARS